MNKVKAQPFSNALFLIGYLFQLLMHYANVALLYPQSYRSDHRTMRYINWMVTIVENMTVTTCHDVVTDFNIRFVDVVESRSLKKHHVTNICFQLEAANQQISLELKQIYEQMVQSGIENSNSLGIKVRLVQSFFL